MVLRKRDGVTPILSFENQTLVLPSQGRASFVSSSMFWFAKHEGFQIGGPVFFALFRFYPNVQKPLRIDLIDISDFDQLKYSHAWIEF